jgi:hypothetical protein
MHEFARVGSLEAAVWLTTALYSGNTVSRVLFSFDSSPGPDGLYGVYAADPMPALSFTETELETCSSEDVVATMRRRGAGLTGAEYFHIRMVRPADERRGPWRIMHFDYTFASWDDD